MNSDLKQKKCEQCGASFSCEANNPNAKCWCMDLPVLDPLPKGISDCLCPNCLKAELAKNKAK